MKLWLISQTDGILPPAKPEWFNVMIDDCESAGVPVYVKKAPKGVPIIREFPKEAKP